MFLFYLVIGALQMFFDDDDDDDDDDWLFFGNIQLQPPRGASSFISEIQLI